MLGEPLTIENICGGAAACAFDRSLKAILDNLRDPHTDPKAKRTLTLEFAFVPHPDRWGASVVFHARQKLPTREQAEDSVLIVEERGTLHARIGDRQPPLFEEQKGTTQ